MSELHAVQETRGSKCVSIWEKQSGGLFRSECLISLCSITHFCRWSSTFSPALQYLLQYLVMPGIKKPGSFDLLGQACGLGRLNLCPVP